MPASDALRMYPESPASPLDEKRIHGRMNANHVLHARARWPQSHREAGYQVVWRMDFFHDGIWFEALGR